MEVVEKFLSIDGEGPTAGELAVFIRLKGCNLRCSWCDTTYSLEETAQADSATAEELYRYVKSMPAHNVTLTGGEPLLHPGVEELLALLNEDPALQVHVETNGSVDLRWWKKQFPWVSFVVDFKLPESGEMEKMDRGTCGWWTTGMCINLSLPAGRIWNMRPGLSGRTALSTDCRPFFSRAGESGSGRDCGIYERERAFGCEAANADTQAHLEAGSERSITRHGKTNGYRYHRTVYTGIARGTGR